MTFSELPRSIKKEFLTIEDETQTFDDLVKSLIKHNKRVFFVYMIQNIIFMTMIDGIMWKKKDIMILLIKK